jgi:hypothetical protein
MRRLLLLLLPLLVALLGCQPALETPLDDTPVRVRAFVEKADVTPGKPFLLTVEIDRRTDVTFDLPDVGADIEGLVIMTTKSSPVEQVGNRVLQSSTYKLKAPKAGTYLIPAVEGPWKTETNEVGTAGTGAILVEAARRDGEEGAGDETLRDLKPAAQPDPDHRPWLILGSVALVLGLLGLFLWRRRSKGSSTAPPTPADVQALLELRQLAELDLADTDLHPVVAYEVSAVLRRYLEARFHFPAWKMTTSEVLRSMPNDLVNQRAVPAAIQEVLEASDLVKFAGESVGSSAVRSWLGKAEKVVEITALPPEEEDAA